jgi:hypothetical protein
VQLVQLALAADETIVLLGQIGRNLVYLISLSLIPRGIPG